jgi:small subunit ribosomal protein S10
MAREKIRVSLYSFNSRILEEASKKILSEISATESLENIKGPIPLPTRKRIYCVLRSPHVDKDSREQFEIRRYKRIIDIYPESVQTLDAFLKLELPPGVSIDVQIYSKAAALN